MPDYVAKSIKQDKEDWMTKKWRPMMAITYMAINIFDFIAMPVLFNLLQFWTQGQAITAYQSLTLQGGGLIHIAFGAILGISAWTRGQEKVAAIENGSKPSEGNNQNFNQGWGTAPETNVPDQPQWESQTDVNETVNEITAVDDTIVVDTTPDDPDRPKRRRKN